MLAILVLGASAASNGAMNKKKFLAEVKAQFKNQQHAKRDNTCVAVKCGEKGDKCDDGTVYCSGTTTCNDGVCTKPIEGDTCIIDCYDDDLYCSAGTCKKFNKAGDECTTYCKSKVKDVPLVCDYATKKCKENIAKIGEPCDYDTVCEGDSVCTNEYSGDGICYLYPTTAGTTCNATYGCDSSKYLYCDGETSKCVELPKDGKECYRGFYCNAGLYCGSDSTCKPKKGNGEECSSYYECKDGLTCGEDNKCHSVNPAENEYCDDRIDCDSRHRCANNACVKKDDTCSSGDDEECAGLFTFCDNGKCKGDMGIAENEKCIVDGIGDMDKLYASMQCKEGLSCVPDSEESSEGKCKKISGAWKECSDDSDCAEGSTCDCNTKDGKMQCIPLPQSDKDFFNKAKKIYDNTVKCDDIESEEEADKCYAKETASLYTEAAKFFDYNVMYRCTDFSALFGTVSAVTVSVVAMAAALFFALF